MVYDAQGSPQGRGRPGPTEISKSAWSHSAPGAQLCARDSAGGASAIDKHLGPSWGGWNPRENVTQQGQRLGRVAVS